MAPLAKKVPDPCSPTSLGFLDISPTPSKLYEPRTTNLNTGNQLLFQSTHVVSQFIFFNLFLKLL